MRVYGMSYYGSRLKRYLQGLDWPLLVFLLLLLNVKLYIKVIAVVFAIILHRRTVFSFNRSAPEQRFYGAMIVLALLNLLLSITTLSMASILSFCMGSLYWLLAMMAARHIRLFVEQGDKEKIFRTLSFFFLLNALIVLFVFLGICIEAGTLNPYTYEGEHRKYFISTGDRITGIGLDGSVATAMISAFGLLYFFYRKKNVCALLSLATLLLATSNYIDLLLICVLLVAFFYRTDRVQKMMIGLYFFVMIIFALKVYPENNQYAMKIMGQAVGKFPYIPALAIPRPHMNDFVEGESTVSKRKQDSVLLATLYTPAKKDSILKRYSGWDISGRWISWTQLKDFFIENPGRLLLGAGIGNFSSRLAFKTAALGIDGGYPKRAQYISPFFRDNYLFLYLYYHSLEEGEHSVINKPDSVYGQLLAEYGLVGLFCFVLWYGIPFLRRIPQTQYGLPYLLLLAGAFFTEYWFEQLSIVILFELLILSDTHVS